MEISPEKYEMKTFSGQEPVRCQIIVVDNNVYNRYGMLNISVVKFPTKMEEIFNKNYQNLLKY